MAVISIVVPVYNTEVYLRRCVDSILDQSFTDFELLLVDDGSTDGSSSICDEYAAKDSRVSVIHQCNAGVSAARNAGLAYAFSESETQYLTFIDSDDFVAPTYLYTLYQALLDNNADISVCGEYTHGGQKCVFDGQRNFDGIIRLDATEACRMIYTGGAGHAPFVTVWGKLYKKELFRDIRFPVGKIHEDQAVIFQSGTDALCHPRRRLCGLFSI